MSLWLILHIPTVALGLLMVGVSATLAMTGLLIVRRVSPIAAESNNAVAAFFVGIIGTAYAIIVGFALFATWAKFTAADAAVIAEANNLGDLVRIAQQFPDPERRQLLLRARSYVLSVTREEWKSMARGGPSPQTSAELNRLWQAYATVNLRSERGRLLYSGVLRYLTQAGDYRIVRVQEARTTIPSALWAVLLVGWATTVGFTYFFVGNNLRTQVMMTGWLGGVMGLLLFVILLLSLPFTGDVSVSPSAFDQVFRLLDLAESP